MSLHNRTCRADSTDRDPLDPNWVTRHVGDLEDFIGRHRRQATLVVRAGRSALQRVAPSLLHRVSHDKVLRIAWNYLRSNGGQSPGVDGLRYSDLTGPEVYRLCREVRNEIRRGEYSPDLERIRWIPKGPGRGCRPLIIQSIIDRMVQRAVVEIIQPLLDPLFDPRSFGFRPQKSTLHALVLAETLCFEEGRTVWVTADVKDAFSNVPLPRLLDVVRRYLIDEELVGFIGQVIGGSSQPGLRQGGCLSPLLLNLYLHHFLDRRWRSLNPDIPLIRYADDILLLCRTPCEARQAHDALAGILRPTAMSLKDAKSGARTLTVSDPVNWMGFHITRLGARLQYGLTEAAWWQLADKIALSRDAPNSPLRVYEAIVGWVGQKGPCFPYLDHNKVYAQIADIAGEHGYDEIPSLSEIRNLWQRAYARWMRIPAPNLE